MALTARLQFGDNDSKIYQVEYLVKDCRCHFSRHYNHFHPDGEARCERMELTVIAPGKENLNLYDWYIQGEPMSGRILFDVIIPQSDQPYSKVLIFDSAYCYALGEEYNNGDLTRRCLRLSLVAEKIIVNDYLFRILYKK